MQILSSALPGFRDLRGPVIAGYMWLLFAWLCVTPDLDHRPDDQIGGSLYDLAHDVGRVGVAVAVSVAAYLIGSISQEVSDALRRGWDSITRRFGFRYGRIGLYDDAGVMNIIRQGEDFIREHRATTVIPDDAASEIHRELETRALTAGEEAQRELNLPATLLVGDRPELFAEVDRLRAEAELRLAVVLPGLALIILLAVLQSLLWLPALVLVGLLLVQGVRRAADSRKVIADAIAFGRIESPSLKKFATWVTDSLPGLVDRAERGEPLRSRAFQ